MSNNLPQVKTCKTAVIIPAAGFGTRVGRPESKEMLISPKTGKILIDQALQAAKKLGASAVVVSREEKKNLNAEIRLRKFHGDSVELFCVSSTREWPETILRSQHLWKEKNIVVLPDTWWAPSSILEELEKKLDERGLSYALFEGQDDLAYGFVAGSSGSLQICEKPQATLGKEFKPWGIFGFRKEQGEAVLKAHLESTFDHQIKTLPVGAGFLNLQEFTDLTRSAF